MAVARAIIAVRLSIATYALSTRCLLDTAYVMSIWEKKMHDPVGAYPKPTCTHASNAVYSAWPALIEHATFTLQQRQHCTLQMMPVGKPALI